MAKKINVYGVEMTSLQEMLFSKYRMINNISMNTLDEAQRKKIAINFIKQIENGKN